MPTPVPTKRRSKIKQPKEWLPVAPMRAFIRMHPDAFKHMDERRRHEVNSERTYWIEFDTVDRALTRTPWLTEDVYGEDYAELIKYGQVPPRPLEEEEDEGHDE